MRKIEMKKTVNGLNLKYYIGILIGAVVGFLALFLPYVHMNVQPSGEAVSISFLYMFGKVSGFGWFLPIGVLCVAVSFALALVNYFSPSKLGVRLMIAVGAFQALSFSIILFTSKSILDSLGVLPEKFMVKYLGIGYWLILVASYVTLIYAMKTAKIHTGYIVLVIMSVIWMFPIVWIVLTSLREEKGFYVGYFIPKGFTLNNYIQLFTKVDVFPFGRWCLNTLMVATLLAIFNTLVILGTAYVLSRMRFQGRKTFMKALLIVGMFPGFMSMIANYNILKGLGLAQSLWALVILGVAGAAMGYHVCKGYFDTIPRAMDEAAIVDGATRWQIFTKITIPLSKPIIVYTVLTSFLGAWSDFIFPSMLLGDKQSSYTAAIGLNWLVDYRRIDDYYTQFAAGSLVIAVPMVILFIALQRFYVEGLSGSVKG